MKFRQINEKIKNEVEKKEKNKKNYYVILINGVVIGIIIFLYLFIFLIIYRIIYLFYLITDKIINL